MRLVGLSGKKQRGKDTVAKRLVVQHGFETDAFAEPLKEACARIFGFSHDQLYGELKEVIDPFWGRTPREIMQKFGTEVGRQIDQQVWVKSFIKRYWQEQLKERMHIVVTDCRFLNEVEAIKQLGGEVWRIERDMPPTEFDIHASETALDDYKFDNVIKNNGTLEELYLTIDRRAESWYDR